MPRAATTTDVFNAVGDPSRRAILDALAHGEASVTEIIEQVDLPQPQVSKHLKVLREVDVVRCRAIGRQRMYRVHRDALRPLQTWLDRLTIAVNEHYDRLDDYLHELQRDSVRENEANQNQSNQNQSNQKGRH